MCTSLPLDPKKVKRWLLAASPNQTFHRSCFIGHCTHCTLYYLFIVLKCKCDPALLSPPLRAVGHLQQRAFCGVVPVALLRYMACRWLHPTSRLRLVNHLRPACPGGRRRGKSDLAAAEKSSCLLEQIQSRSLLQAGRQV